MKKFSLLILILLVVACDKMGRTKQNLVNLTPKLDAQEDLAFKLDNSLEFKIAGAGGPNFRPSKNYKIAKNKIIAQPQLHQNVIYSLDESGILSAFSLKDKKILWSTNTNTKSKKKIYDGGILVEGNKLYVTNGSRYLITIDISNGYEIVRKEFPDILRMAPVLAKKDQLILQTVSNQVISYDIKIAKIRWMYEGLLETVSSTIHSLPVMNEGYVLVSLSSGELTYIDVNTGEEIWNYKIFNNYGIVTPGLEVAVSVTTPIIEDNYAYFATSTGSLVKLDLDNGIPAWSTKAHDILSLDNIEGYLFITNNARQAAAVLKNNGHIAWTGNLITTKERASKSIKTVFFIKTFVSSNNSKQPNMSNSLAANVIGTNGSIYSFSRGGDNIMDAEPTISQFAKSIDYTIVSLEEKLVYLIYNGNNLSY